jgi:hypothetical protein
MNMPEFETNVYASGAAREFCTSEFSPQSDFAREHDYAVVPFEPEAVGPVCESIKAVVEASLPLVTGLVSAVSAERASERGAAGRAQGAASPKGVAALRVLHRIREVRREQGVSSKRAAQLMGKSIETIRAEEVETTDLRLSQLYEWQRLLEVPIEDLLVEPHAPLSEPVLKRARMVRLMKTVQAIMERTGQPSVRRLAQTMVNQLVEIMPELEGVTPWNSLDRKKARNQNSRILESSYLNPAADEDPDE